MKHLPISKLLTLCSLLITAALFTGCSTGAMDNRDAVGQFMENSIIVQNAKRTYQLGHNAPAGTEVTWEDLSTCLPNNWRPLCLEGGHITPGKLGAPMKCSVHGEEPDPRHDHRML